MFGNRLAATTTVGLIVAPRRDANGTLGSAKVFEQVLRLEAMSKAGP